MATSRPMRPLRNHHSAARPKSINEQVDKGLMDSACSRKSSKRWLVLVVKISRACSAAAEVPSATLTDNALDAIIGGARCGAMLGCRDSWLTSEVGVEVADAAGARVGAAAGDPEGA